MSKHDTWVFLKTPSPFDEILPLFPKGFPMRDPFPMVWVPNECGTNDAIWMVDHSRLDYPQAMALSDLISDATGTSVSDLLKHGMGINHKWIERMEGGAECYTRTFELIEFLQLYPVPTNEELIAFLKDQEQRWIIGKDQPRPMPSHWNEYDARLLTALVIERLNNLY
ncbi:hypothetical protein BLD44_017260 [Mastigocladus laminosus UU774]|nr:hypothetical protein BLD44_017260 [Mastigocladus laminosus UU774]